MTPLLRQRAPPLCPVAAHLSLNFSAASVHVPAQSSGATASSTMANPPLQTPGLEAASHTSSITYLQQLGEAAPRCRDV